MIFKPLFINNIVLKNRIVQKIPPTEYATEEGEVTPEMVNYYTEEATRGAGLIILENAFISREGKSFENQLGIYEDRLIPSLKYLANRIKEEGARVALQLSYELKTSPEIPLFEIREIIRKYALAAKRARDAGVDLVEIGSPLPDIKNKFYTGSFEKRIRFPLELSEEIKKIVGREYPIFYRIEPQEFEKEELKIFLKELEKTGIEGVDISDFSESLAIFLGEEIKKYLKKLLIAVKIKSGNFNYLEKILKERKADLLLLEKEFLEEFHQYIKMRKTI